MLGQLAIWGGRAERISAGGRMILDALLEYGDRSRVFRDKLKRFLGDSNLSGGLFGGEVPPIEQIASEAFGVELREGVEFGGEMPSQEFSQCPENSWLDFSQTPKDSERNTGRIDDLLRGPDLSTLRLSAETSPNNDTLRIRIA